MGVMEERAPAEVLDELERKLRGPLPGLHAQLRMAPEPRPGTRPHGEVESSSQPAGVLILFYPKDGRLHLLLTRRTERVLTHRGQISFPGGTQHPGEAIEETALREAGEELGLDPRTIIVIGRLTPLYIPPSNFCIYPVVARLPERPALRPQPEEVAEVLEVPVAHLLDPGTRRHEAWTLNGAPYDVPFYAFGEHKIWGATAMVLAELLALIAG
jgi:8-oxo-dGTP pyrophosphatase MutT (NUDIX family)